jgi:bacterioferritin
VLSHTSDWQQPRAFWRLSSRPGLTAIDTNAVIAVLNKILETELAGVVRYTHYSLMVFGFNRIPIVSWMRDQATEALDHAAQAGELITHLNGHPSLGIGPLLETRRHNISVEVTH